MTADTALPHVPYAFPAMRSERPPLAIVGEAPGAEEALQGVPFVGRSGRLLNEALAEAGIDRAACFVGNVFRVQPPGNKVGHFFRSRARARREGLSIDEHWGPFGTSDWVLERYGGEIAHLCGTLAGLGVRTIVALGRTPAWALAGVNGILAARGKVCACRPLPDAVVVPTYHPSFILRGQWGLKPTFVADLALAAARAAAD